MKFLHNFDGSFSFEEEEFEEIDDFPELNEEAYKKFLEDFEKEEKKKNPID